MTDPRLDTQAARNAREDAPPAPDLVGQVAYCYGVPEAINLSQNSAYAAFLLRMSNEEDGEREPLAPALLIDGPVVVDDRAERPQTFIVQQDGLYLLGLRIKYRYAVNALAEDDLLTFRVDASPDVNDGAVPVAYNQVFDYQKVMMFKGSQMAGSWPLEGTETIDVQFPQRLKAGDELVCKFFVSGTTQSLTSGDYLMTAAIDQSYLMLTYLAPWSPSEN